jgi:hypothetical protein
MNSRNVRIVCTRPYWHLEQTACCSIRRLCAHFTIILSQLSPAAQSVSTRNNAPYRHDSTTGKCVGTESCSQVIRCVTFSTYFCCNEGIALWRGCMPVSFHPVQHRSQYCHEEPTRLFHGQSDVRALGWGCYGSLVCILNRYCTFWWDLSAAPTYWCNKSSPFPTWTQHFLPCRMLGQSTRIFRFS